MQTPIISNDISALQYAPENQYFDRKSARIKPNELARLIVALANQAGGKIAIGIEDDYTITGFTPEGSYDPQEFEQCALLNCEPIPDVSATRIPVVTQKGQKTFILVLDVQPSINHVIRRKNDGKVFLRIKDSSIPLNAQQILKLQYDRHERSFEDEPVEDSSLEDVDEALVGRYQEALGSSVSTRTALRSARFLTKDGLLTKAGVLLFAKNPTSFLPQARVRVMRIAGKSLATGPRLNIVKDRTFEGPIPDIVQNASLFISGLLREYQYLDDDGQFKVIPEYPEFAWFEGLVNAVTHRDYSNAGEHIRISLFDDRMEILSPGKLPNAVTLENMRTTRYSRNPRIAKTLVAFGWVREMNEGVQRIYDEMAAAFLHKPIYSEPEGQYVKLTLENSSTSRVLRTADRIEDTLGEETLKTLNEYEIHAVQLAYTKSKVTRRDLANRIDRSPKTCSEILHGLVDKGVLEWHGSSPRDPRQFYTLVQAR